MPPPLPPEDPNQPLARETDRLQAPWRLRYLESIDDAEKQAKAAKPGGSTGCFLTDYWRSPDRDRHNHVILRSDLGMVLLNAFPYANGHLLCALGEPKPTLLDYTPEQRAALWSLVETASALMEHALEPHGINIGINQGRAAGAGVPQHLHAHLVPRWGGDVNFMSTVGNVRVIPSSLDAMYDRYTAALATLNP